MHRFLRLCQEYSHYLSQNSGYAEGNVLFIQLLQSNGHTLGCLIRPWEAVMFSENLALSAANYPMRLLDAQSLHERLIRS